MLELLLSPVVIAFVLGVLLADVVVPVVVKGISKVLGLLKLVKDKVLAIVSVL